MSSSPEPNGRFPETITQEASTANGSPPQPEKKKPVRPRKPNYGLIHSKPLPLQTHPLPAFHPTNPISLLRLAYTYLSQILAPPSSHPHGSYIGYYSPETRSVHVTSFAHARALWEMGFFGKGTLSRSEPSWLDRETARLKARRVGGGTAEEATNVRRERRRLFKLERARAEAEKIEKQRLVEEGKLDPSVLQEAEEALTIAAIAEAKVEAAAKEAAKTRGVEYIEDEEEPLPEPVIESQEHLQLTLEEAFFLSYGLGVLQIRSHAPTPASAVNETTYTNQQLVRSFAASSSFPPRSIPCRPAPDDQFLLNYVVYHHFRSLGWVVRPGVKFSVDYLLYYRGPVFSHAEFAIMIMPAYTDPYWSTEEGMADRRIKEQKDWWWLHCINRVQSAVLKTLVLCYVDVPVVKDVDTDDIGALLRKYKIREFIIKRWIANRSRD